MTMKVEKLFKASVLLIMFSFVLHMGYTEEMKIGYVDVEKVFNEYKETKKNDEVLKEKGKAKAQERAEIVSEIKKQKEELELLSESGKLEKQAIIDEKIKELKKFDETTKDALRNERDTALKSIFNDIKDSINAYGQSNAYTLILNEKALLYKTEAQDLTGEIIKKINSENN